ncbi:MAG TPA: D-alanyl-D-alanine carboxypeptidase/D-alanyl-D-alanine-endopeptidase [Vicinamibacteria bacterium]|nr:D-alanyl-D-alanine carboxypeptidase/D-alanyl-D-alanine-endopeptidase [Vicinamibacteria bacterium]
MNLAVLLPLALAAPTAVDAAVDAITALPPYAHATIGIEAIDLATNEVVYARSADRLFIAGSTAKLVTAGATLALLGPDHRFHTRVYRTGPVDTRGVLHGDLVLVASGDPNLSNRQRPDGTLAFVDTDHSYGGIDVDPVAGDPLTVVDQLAARVAAAGIRRVDGHVRVDVSLFPEGEREGGTGVVISPVMVNDNVIDLAFTGGETEGAPVSLKVQPETSYVRVVNQLKTGPWDDDPHVDGDHVRLPDGSYVVTLTGTVPLKTAVLDSWGVPTPSRFAAVTLSERLRAHGVEASPAPASEPLEPASGNVSYDAAHQLGEHVSLPLPEEVRVVLKVSQNLHASALPSVLGVALDPGGSGPALQRGFDRMRAWLEAAGLDHSGAVQSDGAGATARFTPHFMASYLAWMARQPYAAAFRKALPVMGRDGTLSDVQAKSPAAGHVTAKTGTYQIRDRLHRASVIEGKGLAGYIETAGGRRLAFAAYANFVIAPPGGGKSVGEALGEIASALYSAY